MKHSQKIIIIILLVAIITFFEFSPTKALSQNENWNVNQNSGQVSASGQYQPLIQDFPTETIFINLPIIEQNAQTTPEPEGGALAEVDPGTPTPTPIPVQRGSANLPIVIGAVAIILVIVLAWFFVGFLPSRNRE